MTASTKHLSTRLRAGDEKSIWEQDKEDRNRVKPGKGLGIGPIEGVCFLKERKKIWHAFAI